MFIRRVMMGIAVGALAATGALVAPAFGAIEQPARVAKRVSVATRGGGFTPASADPRLAAMFARGGLDPASFHFTPAETRASNRAVTVAVRTRSNRTGDPTRIGAAQPTTGIAPIAYSLGAAVGWKRFAVTGDISTVDMVGLPGSRESADVAVSYVGTHFSGRVKALTDRPLAAAPLLIEDVPSYSVDVGGSYSLTHNLDVTAGVRYRSDRERLARVDDNRRDSQAVYLGTAFRF